MDPFIKKSLDGLRNITDLLKKLDNKKKGAKCSVSGAIYEHKVLNVIKNKKYKGDLFTRQTIDDLAGSGAQNDIECICGEKTIGLEIKKYKTPDWMQCSLKYVNKTWKGSKKCKIPLGARERFEHFLKGIKLFNGLIPPFIEKKLTYKEWLEIKKKNSVWKDHYIDIPNDTIKNIYRAKGCYYIQISKYGLYHLGEDIYDFKVPEFIVSQCMRIRIKVHGTSKKYCNLSITAACAPKKLSTLRMSPYSLDDANRLPPNLTD